MDVLDFESILKQGEGQRVEFKRCGGKPENDTFETICAFANHTGGNLFLGVEDDSRVIGVPQNSLLSNKRNIANIINNPAVFHPAVPVEFEDIAYEGKYVIRVWVPSDAFVHSYKHCVYDRKVDCDIQLKHDAQIGALYIRKQSEYTEQKIYPYVEESDFDVGTLEMLRERIAVNRPDHPWAMMSNDEIFRSAGLYTKSFATGEEGFNLASVLLLGKENVISSILPAYKTDAVARIQDQDRYDDRVIVRSNLLNAYAQLEAFCKKHLQDRFYLENNQLISPRDIIVRELIANTLIHREYSSPLAARVIIDNENLTTENASKATFDGPLNLEDFSPVPKNPIIANFFHNIGWADELGSGARNLLKYTRIYSGSLPNLVEGDVFRAVIPLTRKTTYASLHDAVRGLVTAFIADKGFVTTVDVRDTLAIEHKTAQRELAKLVRDGFLIAEGNTRARIYRLAP